MRVMEKRKKTSDGRARKTGAVIPLSVEVTPRLMDALLEAVAGVKPKTSKRGIVEMALETWLVEKGYLEAEDA